MKDLMLILLSCVACYFLTAQNKKIAFLDENYQPISEEVFDKKNNSTVYRSIQLMTDSVIYKRVAFKYYLGTLEEKSKQQLYNLLSQRNGVDTTKTIIIHYRDTLPPISSFPKRDSIAPTIGGGHRHINSHKTHLRNLKSCLRYNTRRKTSIYHFFNFNDGYPLAMEGAIKWNEDPLRMLRKLFYDRSIMNFSWTILIQKNGNFLVHYYGFLPKIFKDLRKGKNWEIHYSDFQKRYNSLN